MKREGVIVTCISILVVILGENNYVVGRFPSNNAGGEQGGGGGGGGAPFQFPIPPNNNNNNNGGGGFPFAGAGIGAEHQKCFESFQKDGLGLPCLQDLGNSFQTQRISLSPACCSYLSNIDEACKPVVHFQNPVFQALVHDHCSQQSSTPAAGADSSANPAATASASGASTVFNDQTGAAAADAQSPSTPTAA